MNLEEYLYQNIPISKALGVKVQQAAPEKVILFAPFASNINHKKTVFGGSLHAVATLACWSLLYLNIHDSKFQIVITKSEIDYLAPIDSDFTAECIMPESDAWQRFMQMLRSKGKARILLSAKIHHNEKLAVDFQGIFAVLNT